MPTQLVAPALVAVAVGGAHFAVHNVAGEESTFDDAGVTQAGLAVMAAAFVLTWALQRGWLDPAIELIQSLVGVLVVGVETTLEAAVG